MQLAAKYLEENGYPNWTRVQRIVEGEGEREIFIQLHIRNIFKMYKLNTKHSCAHRIILTSWDYLHASHFHGSLGGQDWQEVEAYYLNHLFHK